MIGRTFDSNVICFPPRMQVSYAKEEAQFTCGDFVNYHCGTAGKTASGFIRQIHTNAAGNQWRVLVQTDTVAAWKSVDEIWLAS
jgi:hypothetical protein